MPPRRAPSPCRSMPAPAAALEAARIVERDRRRHRVGVGRGDRRGRGRRRGDRGGPRARGRAAGRRPRRRPPTAADAATTIRWSPSACSATGSCARSPRTSPPAPSRGAAERPSAALRATPGRRSPARRRARASPERARRAPSTARRGADPDDDERDDELDPVRSRRPRSSGCAQRARTDLAELRVHYHRHDIARAAARVRDHRRRGPRPPRAWSRRRPSRSTSAGSTFEHSQAWLEPEPLPPSPPRIVRDPTGPAAEGRRGLPRRAHLVARPERADRGPDRQEAGVEQHRHRPRARSPHAVGRAVHARRQLGALDRGSRLAAHRVSLRARRREGRRAARRSRDRVRDDRSRADLRRHDVRHAGGARRGSRSVVAPTLRVPDADRPAARAADALGSASARIPNARRARVRLDGDGRRRRSRRRPAQRARRRLGRDRRRRRLDPHELSRASTTRTAASTTCS